MSPEELLAERPKVPPSAAQLLLVAGIREKPILDGERAVRASRIEAEIALMRAADAMLKAETQFDAGIISSDDLAAAKRAMRGAEEALAALK